MQKFHFIAQRWFAVEEDDGQVSDDSLHLPSLVLISSQVERVLPAAGEVEKGQLSYVLSKKAYHSVSDGHLWFSIFSRPPSDRFTRVQRCTCCFVLLFISMLLNIMYYDVSNEAKSANQTENNGLSIGPLYITPQQVGHRQRRPVDHLKNICLDWYWRDGGDTFVISKSTDRPTVSTPTSA